MNPSDIDLQSPKDALTAISQEAWSWLEAAVLMAPNLLIALVVAVIAAAVARFVGNAVHRTLDRVYDNGELNRLGATGARLAVLIGGLFLALSVMNLDKTVTSLLAGVGVVGLALGFAFQDIAANLMSGVMIASKRPFEIGEWVHVAGHEGVVKRIDLRVVTLQRFSGELVELPNKDVLQNAMVNHDRSGVRRVSFSVGVGYDSDMDRVMELSERVIRAHHTVDTKNPDVLVTAFGGSSIDLELRFWIRTDDELGGLKRKTQAMLELKAAYDQAGIDIPYPIRTLQVASPVEVEALAAK